VLGVWVERRVEVVDGLYEFHDDRRFVMRRDVGGLERDPA
jgi:hypothetical protein